MPPGVSSTMTMKRIRREVADLKKEDLGPISLEPNESDLNVWKGSIPGPEGSLYEGGVFDVEIALPPDYPFSAPKVIFKTRIYHMNISEQGNICIDILKQNWSPALSLFKVMLSLSSLLTDPNPKDPLVPSIATQYTRNRKQHDATARQWTKQFAQPKPPPAPVPQLPPAPASDKAQGKRRAEAPPENAGSARAGRSTRSSLGSATAANPVIVLDSDDEVDAGRSRVSKRKRSSGAHAAAPVRAGEVVELLDSDDEREAAAKKARAQNCADQGPVSAGSGRPPVRQLGDVIVID